MEFKEDGYNYLRHEALNEFKEVFESIKKEGLSSPKERVFNYNNAPSIKENLDMQNDVKSEISKASQGSKNFKD